MKFFNPGDVVVFRYNHPDLGVERGAVARVVEDAPHRTIIHISAGSSYKQVVWMGNAPPDESLVGKFEEKAWFKYSILRIMYPGIPYSVWVMWNAEDGEFVRWYVNIESPFVRNSFGFSAVDYELDIVVDPDWTWAWKDEDELKRHVGSGIFSKQQAAEFKEYGLDALRRLENREAPFDEPWPDWRPDPSWGPLEMPDNEDWLDLTKD